MSDDTKIDFYLANRVLIEEWAGLRRASASALDTALLAGARSLGSESDLPEPVVREEQARVVRLYFTAEPLPSVWLQMWWQAGDLLKGANGWPYLALEVSPKNKPLRDVVRNATAGRGEAVGLTSKGNAGSWWLRSGRIAPESEPIEIESYATFCLERLRIAWLDLNDPVVAAVRSAPSLE